MRYMGQESSKKLIGYNFFKGFEERDQDERDVGLRDLKKQLNNANNNFTAEDYINEIPEEVAKQAGFNYEVRE